jgi:hypothetical protein
MVETFLMSLRDFTQSYTLLASSLEEHAQATRLIPPVCLSPVGHGLVSGNDSKVVGGLLFFCSIVFDCGFH